MCDIETDSDSHHEVLVPASSSGFPNSLMGLSTGWWTQASYFSPRCPTCQARGFLQSTRSCRDKRPMRDALQQVAADRHQTDEQRNHKDGRKCRFVCVCVGCCRFLLSEESKERLRPPHVRGWDSKVWHWSTGTLQLIPSQNFKSWNFNFTVAHWWQTESWHDNETHKEIQRRALVFISISGHKESPRFTHACRVCVVSVVWVINQPRSVFIGGHVHLLCSLQHAQCFTSVSDAGQGSSEKLHIAICWNKEVKICHMVGVRALVTTGDFQQTADGRYFGVFKLAFITKVTWNQLQTKCRGELPVEYH